MSFGSYYDPPKLKPGAKDPGVRWLQECLRLAYPTLYAPLARAGSSDGVFGPATRRAVVELQASAGLDPCGVVEADTWALFARWTVPAVPLSTPVSAHFTVGQAVSKGNGEWIVLWVPEVARRLEAMLAAAGQGAAYELYSWCRDPKHNDAVSTATRSRHKYGGAAVDWRIPGVSNAWTDEQAAAVGFRVGRYDPRVARGQHVDLGAADKGLAPFTDRGYRRDGRA